MTAITVPDNRLAPVMPTSTTPLRYLDTVLLRGPQSPNDKTKAVFVATAYSGTKWFFARWDDSGTAVAHYFKRFNSTDIIKSGDELQLVSSEADMGSTDCLSELEGQTNLVYAASDEGSSQVWTIEKVGGKTGDIINVGDSIKLQNKRLAGYYLSAESDKYLAVRQSGSDGGSIGIVWSTVAGPK